jgi:hypothetical protein
MALANGSVPITPGAGAPIAAHLVNGVQHQVVMTADAEGHVRGSLPAWGLIIPPSAVGASKIYFDLHNNQASTTLRLRKLFGIVATDVAVTGTLGVRVDTMRTSTVGTGGTAALTTASASKTSPSFWPLASVGTLPAGITARVSPAGGATDEQWLWPTYLFTEETNASTQMAQFFNLLPELSTEQSIELPTGKGLKVVQGAIASVGSLGFMLIFTIE